MNLDAFKAATAEAHPPEGLPAALAALWWIKKGDWEQAHSTAQADPSKQGAWVHAHLHRVEGDLDNAGYWYGQAARSRCTDPLDEEWDRIAATLLASASSAVT